MTVDILNETEKEFDFDYEKLITDCVRTSCDYVQFPYEPSVNVLITDLSGIQEINRDQRGIDKPTDVLSFPLAEYDKEADFECFEDDISLFDPDTEEAVLGDIVLCYDRIISQAQEYGHSVRRELAFLTVHSMLHLFGYDHEHDGGDDEILIKMGEKMEKAQEEILSILQISRD